MKLRIASVLRKPLALFSPLASVLGFTLPPLYWTLLGLTLGCYVVLRQAVELWPFRRAWM